MGKINGHLKFEFFPILFISIFMLIVLAKIYSKPFESFKLAIPVKSYANFSFVWQIFCQCLITHKKFASDGNSLFIKWQNSMYLCVSKSYISKLIVLR